VHKPAWCLPPKRQRGQVFPRWLGQQRWLELVVVIKPELHLIDEVEAAPVDNGVFLEMVFGSEENGGGKDSLKSCFHSPVLGAVLTKSKVVEELGGTFELDDTVSLSQGECSEPGGDQPVLSVRWAETGVGGDLEEEVAVSASVNDLVGGRLAQRQSTKYKGAGLEGDCLLAIVSLVADHLDGFQFLDGLLGDADPWED
jgi:hypothetical protein